MADNVTRSLSLPRELNTAAQESAAALGVSVADVIRMALRQFINDDRRAFVPGVEG